MHSPSSDDEVIDDWPLEPTTDTDNEVASRFLSLVGGLAAGRMIEDLDEFEALRDQFLRQGELGGPEGDLNFHRWDDRTILARSWRHARAYLHWTDFHSRLHGPPRLPNKSFLNDINVVAHLPRLLRGQRDYRWHLTASIHRPDVKREEAEAVLRAFVAVLRTDLADVASRIGDGVLPPASEHAALAIAQHYQLATPLLDWTREPDVAVAFACGDRPLKPEDTPLATVLLIPSDEAVRLGAHIIFPPPFATRLYQQRGVFIKMDAGNEETVYAACHKIIFPRPPTPVGYYNDLLPDDPYLRALVQWASSVTSLSMSVKVLCEAAHAHLDRINAPTPWSPERIDRGSISGFVQAAQTLLDSVAFITLAEDGPRFDSGVVDAVRRDNPGFLEWLAANGGRVM